MPCSIRFSTLHAENHGTAVTDELQQDNTKVVQSFRFPKYKSATFFIRTRTPLEDPKAILRTRGFLALRSDDEEAVFGNSVLNARALIPNSPPRVADAGS